MSDVVSDYCQFVIEYLVEFIVVGGDTVYDSYSFLFLECVLQPKSQSLKHIFYGPISKYSIGT